MEKQVQCGTPKPEFRFFLQEELERRIKKNPKYSLRAFARSLDFEPSYLSKILNGKRTITKNVFNRLITALELNPTTANKFLDQKVKASAKSISYHKLEEDEFEIISNWYHYAILEVIQITKGNSNYFNIAKKLGIKKAEAKAGLARLERLQFIKKVGDRYQTTVNHPTTTNNSFTNSAFRKMQRQILTKAIDAMEITPYEKREQTSITVAGSKKRISEIKHRITQFREEILSLLEEDDDRDEVYMMSISLFPITSQGEIK